MKSIAQVLAEQPFFDGVDEATLATISGCARNVHFRESEVVFRADTVADRCYILRTGRVAIQLTDSTGRTAIMETVDAGGMVGLGWFVPPYRWYADAVAVESTNAVVFDATCLRASCDEDPRVGYLLMRRVGTAMHETIRSARVRLLDLYRVPDGS